MDEIGALMRADVMLLACKVIGLLESPNEWRRLLEGFSKLLVAYRKLPNVFEAAIRLHKMVVKSIEEKAGEEYVNVTLSFLKDKCLDSVQASGILVLLFKWMEGRRGRPLLNPCVHSSANWCNLTTQLEGEWGFKRCYLLGGGGGEGPMER